MSLITYALKISYVGTRYNGWQKQPGDLPTIQDCLESAALPLAQSEPVKTLGSGRTDTGVHAFGQIVRLQLDRELAPARLVQAINTKLPWDIRVLDAQVVDADFHPVRDAENKEYWYFMSEGVTSPFLSPHLWVQERPLNWKLMQQAAELFIGEWDFARYQTVGTKVNSTVRTIYQSTLTYGPMGLPFADSAPHSHVWLYQVRGSGFLKQMVRLMVGTLVAVGKGKVSLDELADSLQHPGPKLAAVSPAHGLHLHHVSYPFDLFKEG